MILKGIICRIWIKSKKLENRAKPIYFGGGGILVVEEGNDCERRIKIRFICPDYMTVSVYNKFIYRRGLYIQDIYIYKYT